MVRNGLAALVALAFFMISPVRAGEGDASNLNERIQQLNDQIQELESRQQQRLRKQIDEYLARSAWESADGEGDGMDRLTIQAHVTVLTMGTVGLDPADSTIATYNAKLRFNFDVTESLNIFAEFNTSPGSPGTFPSQFPTIPGPGGGTGATLSGLSDGIGVDGTVPIAQSNRGLNLWEAGVVYAAKIGDRTLHIEWGSLDPRRRYQQNAFSTDANLHFMNNVFSDSSAILWMTDATSRSSLGLNLWIDFGANDQFRVSTGWFNTVGRFWDKGQWFVQFRWRLEVAEREMNIRLFGFIDNFFVDPNTGDGTEGGGATWDWWVTDKIGLMATFTTGSGTVNPVEWDFTFGVIFQGVIGRRPDDVLGIAIARISVNRDHFAPVISQVPADTENILEIYYRFSTENGFLQVTPFLQVVSDPGAAGTGWLDNTLVMLGIRVHVPF